MNFYEKVIMFGHVPDSMLIGNRRINLTNKSRYAQYIYLSISLAFGTEWYRGLAPSKSRDVNVLGFINWINNYEEGELLEPNFLKEYETYRVVKEKVKPQSSGLSNIIGFLEASKPELHSINKKAYIYIKNILASTTVSFPDKREQYTLCDWFLEMEWLNSKMGDGYALLESPKILMSSFSLTVALLLSRIIKLKKQFRNIRRGGKVLMWVPENLISACPSENSILKHHKNKKNDECNVNYKLMWVGENSEEIVLDPVVSNSYSNSFSVKNKLGFELFSAIEYMSDSDLIKLVTFESVTNEAKLLLLNYQKLGSQHRYFARPEILGPHSLYAASKVEEWLCAYLFAWLAVQPTDILNLKRNNIAIIKNKGGIANIQVKYFKGRAGMQMETMFLIVNMQRENLF